MVKVKQLKQAIRNYKSTHCPPISKLNKKQLNKLAVKKRVKRGDLPPKKKRK